MFETPAALGYRMPAEWEPHAAVWLAWPYNPETWGNHLEGTEKLYEDLVAALAESEHVHILVQDEAIKQRIMRMFSRLPREHISFHSIESGDVWFRDYGPLFLKHANGKVAWTNWIYNAYGNKWDDLLIGNEVPEHMPLEGFERFDTGLVLEGGSIDVNGAGLLLTTESCLLSSDRNPHLSREHIEQALKDFLGISTVLWLSRGIAGDDTTGHVDDVARFVNASTIVTAVETDAHDENYVPLQENLERLMGMKDEKGHHLGIIALPMPRPFFVDGRRMAASYANFYIANSTVLIPTYNQPSDIVALDIFRQLFPDRAVKGLDCRDLIFGYGSLHCITMQQPA